MRVLSWNLAARRNTVGQVAAIAGMAPDVVVFQEVTPASLERLRPLLRAANLAQIVSGPELAGSAASFVGRFVVVASRWQLGPSEQAVVPAPERVVCVVAATPSGPLEVVGVHIPNYSPFPLVKIETQEGVAAHLLRGPECPSILAGDFNSPRSESLAGDVLPFSAKRNGRAYEGELSLLTGLREAGMVDAYRAVNGYATSEMSWCWRRGEVVGGFRLDHILASRELNPVACRYAHECREAGLSDHSPVVADFEPARLP